jgi:hypothetical protein
VAAATAATIVMSATAAAATTATIMVMSATAATATVATAAAASAAQQAGVRVAGEHGKSNDCEENRNTQNHNSVHSEILQ